MLFYCTKMSLWLVFLCLWLVDKSETKPLFGWQTQPKASWDWQWTATTITVSSTGKRGITEVFQSWIYDDGFRFIFISGKPQNYGVMFLFHSCKKKSILSQFWLQLFHTQCGKLKSIVPSKSCRNASMKSILVSNLDDLGGVRWVELWI